MPFDRELAAVQRWLDETDRIALEHFSIRVATETKRDGSPVTVADRGIEASLRRAIEAEFPSDAIFGEEEGESGSGDRRWIIDPIDATKNYARGIPIFGTLVALEADGRLVLGAVSAPALRTRWWATRGGGAFRDGEPIRVSDVEDLANAEIGSGNIRYADASGNLDAFIALCRRVRRTRGFGDFYAYMLVAQGSTDISLEFPGLGPWDLAAPKAIVEEAGGRLTSLGGEDRFDAGDSLATNGLLHEQVLAVMRGSA